MPAGTATPQALRCPARSALEAGQGRIVGPLGASHEDRLGIGRAQQPPSVLGADPDAVEIVDLGAGRRQPLFDFGDDGRISARRRSRTAIPAY